ncbi:unnamed protein product [Adineta ricciae]|uniref:Uncharacterized protein n=1 Tax=Adineta ricciae TaxID=249248 RepID=A0A816HDS4_ADIRI|nr:unnamed protein product [Adineta ricciae]
MAAPYREREPVQYYQPLPASTRVVYPNNGYHLDDQQIKARQQMAHVNVVVTQPGRSVWDYEHPWSTELCSCCSDCKQCGFAFFCSCCFEYKLHKRAGEKTCTCLCPGSRFALRSKIRTAFRIQGDLIDDCCTATCCPCCTSIQLTRELHYQGL